MSTAEEKQRAQDSALFKEMAAASAAETPPPPPPPDYERLYVELLEGLENIGFSLQAQAKNQLAQYKNSKQQQQQKDKTAADAQPKP